jgi:biotin carboxyl carrier protein
MSYEISLNGEISAIQLQSHKGNNYQVMIGDRSYALDVVEVEPGVYSILMDGKSYNVELTVNNQKNYSVNTLYNNFIVDIIDAESRYMNARREHEGEDVSYISTPMPGKVMRILVKEGDEVKAGETLIIVSAMKMESEYKVLKDKKIKSILVKEGDSIEGNQPLILLE